MIVVKVSNVTNLVTEEFGGQRPANDDSGQDGSKYCPNTFVRLEELAE